MAKSSSDSENYCVRVNRTSGSNVAIATAVDAHKKRTGRNRSDAMADLVLRGSESAELMQAATEGLRMIEHLRDVNRTTRHMAREVLDAIIGALRRGDHDVAREIAHAARWEYFANKGDLGGG